MRFFLLAISVLCWGAFGYSQVSTVTLSTTKCSHVFSAIDVNYNNPTFSVGTTVSKGGGFFRGFIEFDVSSIPSNAIITSATLTVTNAGGTYVSNPWVTKLVESSWSETLVKISNQPTISASSSDWETSYSNSGNDVNIDVKNTVQRMVNGLVTNYGWCIQVQNEGAAYVSGTYFHSDEASSNQPELKVVYYEPVSFSSVQITHESATGQSDGSISFSHTALDSTGHTYTWINSSGTQLQTGSTSTIDDLSYGWYGLEIEGNTNGETYYYGFLVGTECEEVTITYLERADYVDNSLAYQLYPSNIYVDYGAIRGESWTNGGVWYDMRTFMLFRTWMDDAFTINQADIEMHNYPFSWARHYSSSSPNNSGKFNIITQAWDENVVSHNNQPSTSSSVHAVASTTGLGYSTASQTFDMINLWDDWKSDNTANYGCGFELDDYSIRNKQLYTSSHYSNSTYHPEWTFKLDLSHSNNPIFCGGAEERPYNELKKELDGGYGESYDDTLNFVLDEDYGVDTLTYLTITVYDDDHDVLATCDADGNTTGGMPARIYVFDDNRYVMDLSGITTLVNGKFYLLEVKNAKDDRFYLKFKHNE